MPSQACGPRGLQGSKGEPGNVQDAVVAAKQFVEKEIAVSKKFVIDTTAAAKQHTENETAAAKQYVEDAVENFQVNLLSMIVQELQSRGVIDEFGKAILIPGPAGESIVGPAGKDGKSIVGPQGIEGDVSFAEKASLEIIKSELEKFKKGFGFKEILRCAFRRKQ